MAKLKTIIQKSLVSAVAFIQIAAFPVGVYAQEAGTPVVDPAGSSSQPAESTAPVCPAPSGTNSPTGSAAHTYTYNPVSCLWENQYYTWDAVTKQYASRDGQEYYFNPTNNTWVLIPPTVLTVPEEPVSQEVTTPLEDGESSATSTTSSASLASLTSGPNTIQNNIAGVSPTSTNSLAQNGIANANVDIANTALIQNYLTSTAGSGDVGIAQNTSAGSALTGDAQTIANILNLLNSSWNPQNGEIATFVANIDGDVVGDLYINTQQIPQNRNLAVSSDTGNNLQVNIDNEGRIDNNINLLAESGDATLAENTNVGNATTGSAQAIANVINVINSAISAGQSFVGVININGNLDGDILLPPNFIDQLLASGAPHTTVSSSLVQNSQLTANLNNEGVINNNVNATAASGDANVTQNTTAGNAQTGTADTNVTIFNLTGRQIVGKNALLVFVNVMGEWVGLIMDAPAGTTSAALGGGINQNNSLIPTNGSTEINSTNNNQINNNINVAANSGDASLIRNTSAGNATTGDASASVNLLNILNSSLSFGDWFGVLFINVFGSWKGSFGKDTVAGTRRPPVNGESSSSNSSTNVPAQVRVFGFVSTGPQTARIIKPKLATSSLSTSNFENHSQPESPTTGTTGEDNAVKAVSTTSSPVNKNTPKDFSVGGRSRNWAYPAIAGAVALTFLGAELAVSAHQRRQELTA